MMYGVTCGQVIVYYRSYHDDKLLLKLLVSVVLAGDTLHQVLMSHIAWFYLISQCKWDPCLEGSWSLAAQAVPSELDRTIVKSFYIIRTWKLSGRKKVLLLFIPSLLSLVFGLLLSQEFAQSPSFSNLIGHGSRHRSLEIFLSLGSLCNVTSDIGLIITMYHFLYKAQNKGPQTSRPMRSVLNTVVCHSVASGLLTCIVSSCFMITYLALRGSLVWLALYFVNSRLYVNSMLAALNSRAVLRERLEGLRQFSVVSPREGPQQKRGILSGSPSPPRIRMVLKKLKLSSG
ncbi:hypothetical protein NEOLEDRAFT_1140378 [Neolentinus lepideus HHB14362 ss-1]|uniref:DUF6534 domain-containing protein n=1 Tax=Neolentinus lepideus HHB14362 ss-1 TaxID=1314782 RepID=A0A165P8N8_9AGAM|nr:hypothetical protein NEOLEDRAFT_1140378 [Neolentinus lepideus HHB14362 ss-1]